MAGFGGWAEAGWLLTWGPLGQASLKVVDLQTKRMRSSKNVGDQSMALAAGARETRQEPAASSAGRDFLPISSGQGPPPRSENSVRNGRIASSC